MTDLPKEAVEIWTSIEGNDAAATKRLREAYHRWFTMCCCGHDAEKHDAQFHCSVGTCDCSGYDHLTGKPDHPCNPLPADDPRASDIRKQELREARDIASSAMGELVALREAVATHLIYLDEEIVAGLRDGRHTREVAANIGQHQSRNLRRAVEVTGGLSERDGTAGPSLRLPDNPTPLRSFFDSATQKEIRRHYAFLEDSDA